MDLVTSKTISALRNMLAYQRKLTLKRLEEVPKGFHNWRLNITAMSFAELMRHLIKVDELFLTVIRSKNRKYIWVLGTDLPHFTASTDQYERLKERLLEVHNQREHALDNLGIEDLEARITDDSGKKSTLFRFILEKVMDHEAYHRGQVSAYLKMLKGHRIE